MSLERPVVVAERPGPGAPRPYHFPRFVRSELPNGLKVVAVHLPGRGLVSATLVSPGGAAEEPDELGGATVLMARALSEGTARHDAVGLVEAGERLGASLHAEAGWDAWTVSVDVPGERLAPALELLAEMAAEPSFPPAEVERLRDERLNDLLQAQADPRRRADEAFIETIYAPTAGYRRPSAGLRETVERLDDAVLRSIHARRFEPAGMTLVVGGDLTELDVRSVGEQVFGGWTGTGPAASAATRTAVDAAARRERLVRVVDRPGAVQTEIRIGHPGAPRRIADFHALSVMSAILGGLFDSRLNRNLREDKGWTYGAGAGFDLRRSAGPFSARAAVNTDVTVRAVVEMLRELDGIRAGAVEARELDAARDYLIGVFPLRFETPAAVVGALSGLVVHGLPDDELDRYRDAVAAVDASQVHAAALSHIRPDEASIVLVGAADAFGAELEGAGVGPVVIDRGGGPGGAVDPGA
jgi:zinc protease